jgi:Serine dehydrogenase proteinase
MTSVMLATYLETFAAGGVVAGLDRRVDGVDLVVARPPAAAVVEIVLKDDLLGVVGQTFPRAIETIGVYTDATEKIAALLRSLAADLRVIVPCRAKSNGTMLALVGSKIVMGPCSELGPADPFIQIAPNNPVPAHFLVGVENVDPIISQAAQHAIAQTAKLAPFVGHDERKTARRDRPRCSSALVPPAIPFP